MSELTTLFQNTADAIRSKTGDPAAMKASQFPAKIQGISVGISQDEADARYLQLAGGTMTGALTLSGDPTGNLQAATKQYVDNAGSKKVLLATFTSAEKTKVVDFSTVLGEMVALRMEALGAPSSVDKTITLNGAIWLYTFQTSNNKLVTRVAASNKFSSGFKQLSLGPFGPNNGFQTLRVEAPLSLSVNNTYGLTINLYAEL